MMNEELIVKYSCKSCTVNQFNSDRNLLHSSCSFLHCNVRSLTKNFDSFVNFLSMLDQNFLFIALTETWLHPDSNCCLYDLPSYTFVTCNREASQGGGVALYFHNSLSFSRINTCKINHCESIFGETMINNKKIVIGVIYRRPNTPFNEFIDSLEACLDQVSVNGRDCILLGDMNIDTSLDSPPVTHYNTLLNTYNMTQLINTPTRVTNTSQILLTTLLSPVQLKQTFQTTIQFSALLKVCITFLKTVPKHTPTISGITTKRPS